jgi:hypothetical protein
MKKILMFTIVMGFASAANAGIVLDLTSSNYNVNPGEVVTLSVTSDTSGAGGNYWSYLEMNLPSLVSVGTPVATAAAGNIASVTDYSSVSLLDVELAANDSGGNVVAGLHFTASATVSLSAVGGDVIAIWITGPNDGTYSMHDSVALTVIPEPMTMSLLALGGLGLLRRRRLA